MEKIYHANIKLVEVAIIDFRAKNITNHKEGYLVKGIIHDNQCVEETQMSIS